VRAAEERLTLVDMTEQSAPAGWYPHPSMAGTQRYWDGGKWTDHIAPGLPQQSVAYVSSPAPVVASEGDVRAAYVLAVLMPLIGFVLGILLLNKGRKDQGVWAMVLAVISACVWGSLIAR
jgi:hypothetical protein